MRKVMHFFLLLMLLLSLQQLAGAQEQWIPQNSGTTVTLYRVQFLDANLGYVVGDNGTVLKTTNGGTSWVDVSIQSSYPVHDLSFVSDSLGWVVTGDPNNSMTTGSVWNTTNGGGTWTQQPLGTTNARLGVSFVSTTQGWACGANNGPWDIRATTNGGLSWNLQSGSGYGWTYDINCISPTLGWTVGVVYFPSSSGFVLKTTNGSTWNQLNTGTVPFLYGVQFVDADYGFAVGDGGTVLATTNGGTSWTTQNTGTTANLSDVSFVSASLGWVCGASGTILKTTDGGLAWNSQTSGTNAALNGIFFINSTTGWAVGESGTILTTLGSPTATVTLTPYNPPVQIPATGGSFDYNIEASNGGTAPVSGDVWCDVTLPNGNPYGPTLGPVSITLNAGQSLNRDRSQAVPGAAPAGTYTYNAYIGDYPGVIWAQDSFTFEKLGVGDLGLDQWLNDGQPFPGEAVLAQTPIPEDYILSQNFPNPFNPATQIHFALPEAGQVSLKVYNTAGRLVATLVDGYRQSGWHEVTWDPSDLATGLYVYRLRAGGLSFSQKAILVK